ncbi:MAG: phosphotransferase [Pseudomonadota bacterium]
MTASDQTAGTPAAGFPIPKVESPEHAVAVAREFYPEFLTSKITVGEGAQTLAVISGDNVICLPKKRYVADFAPQEAELLAGLVGRITTVDIPVVRHFDRERNVLILSRIKGSPLKDQFDDLSAEKLASIGRRLGVFMAEMHAIQCYKCDEYELYETNGERRCPDQFDKNKADIVHSHLDVHSDNVLYDAETDTVGVIDFTCTGPGYRHEEFFKLDLFPEALQIAAFDSYNEVSSQKIDLEVLADYVLSRKMKAAERHAQKEAKTGKKRFAVNRRRFWHFSLTPDMLVSG